ncbi:CaiB/BaiF CoA transferase family protein [Verticiella sediminum]|uniref:CaiB/BaiF CoA transferase family protein n=1 Tax=Verticiella sediminum TaxID=1247510 RepID=UPI001FE98081|nr:CoA transferase [Verticiella sediminum]
MTSPGPLSGIRVLDLSSYIAAPYGCTLLADQGAEVIKIEPPQGDNLRKYPSTLQAEGRAFLGINRGKIGMVLNLKQPQGLEVLLRLVRAADVLVHNFRPGVPERLGIDHEALKQHNPRLIYCTVSGYGETGPLKDKAGYDQVLQAMTGVCAMQGTAQDPKIVYGSVVDYYAAALLAGTVSSALFQRERTGRGQYVGISLLRSALAMQSARFVWADNEPRQMYRDMRSGGITGLYPTRQGILYISANTPHFWAALCELVGLPRLKTDPRYETVRLRAEHADELVPQLREALAARSALEWETLFGDRVPCARVLEIEDMFDHSQVLTESMVHTFEHPTAGHYRGLSSAFKFGDAAPSLPRPAPTFGQHSDEVLAAAGYGADEIATLRAAGAVC